MRVYQTGIGTWVLLLDNDTKQYFETEQEAKFTMAIQEEKLAKSKTVQVWATNLAGLDDFLEVVNARGFGYEQENEPTSADLAEQGITQDDYRNGIAMLAELRKFISGDTSAVIADRAGVINRLRTDV